MGGQDRIPGTAQGPLAQRLWSDMTTQLAERIGCCPIHGTRLICALHDVELTSSAAEKAEMEALMRLDVNPPSSHGRVPAVARRTSRCVSTVMNPWPTRCLPG